MVRNSSLKLRLELQNLDKDRESSELAMDALKSYVEDMDSKDIPWFLALVLDTKGIGGYTISLYEVVARTHGVKIIYQIDNIMRTVVEALRSNDDGFVVLLEGCAKLVQTIARYGIDPTTHEDNKKCVIHSLCKPLSDCLMNSRESLSVGAAFCLKTLVESDNWRFASTEMANEVCVRAASALEGKFIQLNSHMGLVTALSNRNVLVVDPYARLVINDGLQILQDGIAAGDLETIISAIRMIHSMVKNLDPRSVFPELEKIIEKMEKCCSDEMEEVNIAAYECLLTAKGIISRTRSEQTWSYDGLNYIRRDSSGSYSTSGGSGNLYVGSLYDSDLFQGSPIPKSQRSCGNGYSRRTANRKLWRQENVESTEFLRGHSNDCRQTKSATPSSLRLHSPINVDNVKICSTPRNLMFSLEDEVKRNSAIRRRQLRKTLSPYSNFDLNTPASYCQNGSRHIDEDSQRKEYTSAESVEFHIRSEVLSSSKDNIPHTREVVPQSKTESVKQSGRIVCHQGRYKLILCFLLVTLTIASSSFFIKNQGEKSGLVPT